jgi:septum formation protein
MRLVLASTSPYRRELLARLGLPFAVMAPNVDETPHDGEPPETLVTRLAEAKAAAVAAQCVDALIIGSDQMAVCKGEILGKPGNHERAVQQLTQLSGQRITLLTGLCLMNTASNACETEVVPYHVVLRTLTPAMIEHYLIREKPYDCTGAVKSEGLGIALIERHEGDDPSALIGLPLIRLTRMLERAGTVVV